MERKPVGQLADSHPLPYATFSAYPIEEVSSINRQKNINVRAAFVHVIGDLVQSIGVMIAALVIKFTQWKLADPVCTFIFSVLVLITTLTVMRDAVIVLMEGERRSSNSGCSTRSSLHIFQALRGMSAIRRSKTTSRRSRASRRRTVYTCGR